MWVGSSPFDIFNWNDFKLLRHRLLLCLLQSTLPDRITSLPSSLSDHSYNKRKTLGRKCQFIAKEQSDSSLSSERYKAMLKSLNRCVIQSQFENVIIACMRQHTGNMNNNRSYTNSRIDERQQRPNINNYRRWVPVERNFKPPGLEFSVLSYNILSQRLLEQHNYLYPSQDKDQLLWNRRFYNLVGEILYNKPDILCCQVLLSQLDSDTVTMTFRFSGSTKFALVGYQRAPSIAELRSHLQETNGRQG